MNYERSVELAIESLKGYVHGPGLDEVLDRAKMFREDEMSFLAGQEETLDDENPCIPVTAIMDWLADTKEQLGDLQEVLDATAIENVDRWDLGAQITLRRQETALLRLLKSSAP